MPKYSASTFSFMKQTLLIIYKVRKTICLENDFKKQKKTPISQENNVSI